MKGRWLLLCVLLVPFVCDAASTRQRIQAAESHSILQRLHSRGNDRPFLLPVGLFGQDDGTTNDPIRDIDKGFVPNLGALNVMNDRLLRLKPDYNPIITKLPKGEAPMPNPEDLALKRPVLLKNAIRTWQDSQ